MKLYYAPGACSLADHIALVEAGLTYELAKVDLKSKRLESGGDYTAINPKGYVPALELDDGAVLTENIAILSYVAGKAGKLMSPEGMAHWRMLETLAFVSTELHKNFKPFFSPDAREEDKKKAGEILTKRSGVLEQQLGDRAFIMGEELTVTDCYLFVTIMWAREKAGLALPQQLNGYYDRLRQRPAFKQALDEEGLG